MSRTLQPDRHAERLLSDTAAHALRLPPRIAVLIPCFNEEAAIASVIEAILGSADVPEVTLTSLTAPGVAHRWTNIWAYADEVAMARIYAGFHYRFSTRVGQDMGRKIGRLVVQNLMQRTSVADTR